MRRIAALLLAAAPLACTSHDKPFTGTTFSWGKAKDAKFLDPAVLTDGESVQVVTNIFDTLVAFKPGTTQIVPSLATSWETSKDGLVWTFHLRKGVKFHDGSPMNADAVVFSFLRQKDPKNPAHKGPFAYYEDNFKALEKVEAVDPLTVRFTLSRPYAPFLSSLALFSAAIESPKAWASEGIDEKGKYRYDFAHKPVGTGPFVFVEWKPDERIVLKANDDYFGGRPKIDRLVFRPIALPEPRLKAVESDDIQGMENPDPLSLARIRRETDLRVLERPGLNVCYLAMNVTKRPFDDVRVRRAVAFAIDKQRLIQAAYDGHAVPATTMLPVSMWGHLDLQDRVPDAARSRALLKEAGFPKGFSTELWYGDAQRAYLPDPDAAAIQIQQDLKAAGITVRLRKMEWGAFLKATQNGEHPMCLMGWMADIGDPDNFLYVLCDKANARKGTANNVSFYTGEKVHELLLQAQATAVQKVRARLYREVQRILFQDVPTVPLATAPDVRIVRSDVEGYTIYPAGGEYFKDVRIAKRP